MVAAIEQVTDRADFLTIDVCCVRVEDGCRLCDRRQFFVECIALVLKALQLGDQRAAAAFGDCISETSALPIERCYPRLEFSLPVFS
jgi:hypothetical protein